MTEAIIYTSNAGSTEKYAKLLSEKIGVPAYTLSEALKLLPSKTKIIYLGWIMAGSIKGYSSAAEKYTVCAVCGVGMGQTGTQTENVRTKTHIPNTVPLFTLQGNFSVDKLHGVYRLMMKLMVKFSVKSLLEKPDRTPEEDDMLDMMLHGNERVKAENLSAVLAWCNAQK